MDTLIDSAASAAPDAGDLFAQLGDADPRIAALCRFFAERQSRLATETPPDAVVDADAHRALEAECARLKRAHRAMRRDVDALRDHVAMTAVALGACDACWGQHDACPHCGGRGRPGFDSPDPVLYARLVAPAVRRLRRDEGLDAVDARFVPPDRAAGSDIAGPHD